MSISPSALNAALFYASCGVPVLPLRGKIPRIRRGCLAATTDEQTIRRWFAHPNLNIGLRPPEGMVILDVDDRNGGHESLAALEANFGALPTTLTCLTGGGGKHLWFAYSGFARGKLAEGIDVKTHRGYVVAPPSIHPATGEPYRWVDPAAATVPAPGWLRALLSPPRMRSPQGITSDEDSLARLTAFVAASESGERNRRLYWACLRAGEQELDTQPLIDAAIDAGLTESEIHKTAASAARAVADA